MPVKLKALLLTVAATFGVQLNIQTAQAQTDMPDNISRGLRLLMELYRGNPQTAFDELESRGLPPLVTDAKATKPIVQIYLDGQVPLDRVSEVLQQQGVVITANSSFDEESFDEGIKIIEAMASVNEIESIARMEGVRSVTAVHRPMLRVGAVISQAVTTQNVLSVQEQGILGSGIRVGALSDSYDTSTSALTSAEDDILSGDLPGLLNPLGANTPVTVLEDFFDGSNIDEGRAMLQLIHDIAPAAELGFATAFNGQVSFAQNILRLWREFGADVIVDDVIYFAEPFFSDGIIAQAVDLVANSGSVAYYSSAGNEADLGYESTYRSVSRAVAEKLVNSGLQNLNLDSVPETLANSFHDFDPGSGLDISQSVEVPDGELSILSFQWDEPFGLGLVETDYNILVFSASGEYLDTVSGTDNNLAIDQPLEIIALDPGQYQMAISLVNSEPTEAQEIKYVDFGRTLSGEFVGGSTIVGHPAARDGVAVGAIFYQTPDTPESFTSLGPTTIFFDNAGNRLSEPEIRQTPLLAGVDGTNTTFFFGNDVEGDGFPNFFGTSAAAPNVAAVAALVLEAAGGSDSLSPLELNAILAETANDAGASGFDNLTGFGLVDALRAIQSLSEP